MHSYCFPSSELPGASKLFTAYLHDFRRVAAFYERAPSLEGALRAAGAAAIPAETRREVVAMLRRQSAELGGDASVDKNLARLQNGAVAVVTGQQAGLLTGPAYTIHKAVTAIAVARWLTAHGVDAVPIFWIATEDHDLAEVNQSHWLHRGEIETLRVAPAAHDEGRSVGALPLGRAATHVARRAIELLEGPESDALADLIEKAVRPEETFASSFAKLMADVFAGRGLILLDPRAPELHRLAAPLFRGAITQRADLTAKLLARGKALEKAGFHVQVKVTETSTPLFLNVEDKRVALRQRGEKLAAGERTFSEAELLAHLDAHPENFSGNALFRPVVQDALLPTAAFIVGPAETAYLAQSEVLYREVLGRMPVVLPRASFTIVEPHVARLLKKYGLKVEDVLAGPAKVRRHLERSALPAGLAARFAKSEKELRALLKKLTPAVTKLDKTLQGAAATAERKMLFQFAKLRDKAARARAFRSSVLAQHEQMLVNSLAPHKAPQERTWSMLPLLARHGLALLDELERHATEPGKHYVLSP